MKASPIKRLVFSLIIGVAAALGILVGLKPPPAQAIDTSNNYFVTPHGSGGCSQMSPCNLSQALSLAKDGDSIYLAEGVYTGTGAAVVTLTHSIRLLGGWNGAPGGFVIRDPGNYVSQLDGERERRVVMVQGNITPTLDGLTIAHGNASKLVQGCPYFAGNPDGCGGGIFVIGQHPIIANNIITNNIAAISSIGYPTGTVGFGGGIFLYSALNAIVRNNQIISNAASTANSGAGGGIFLTGLGSGVQIQDNEISDNHATTQDTTAAWGGGIFALYSWDAIIKGNHIQQNWSNAIDQGIGGGIGEYFVSYHYIDNLVTQNYGDSAVSLEYSQSRFEKNLVLNNHATVDIDISKGENYGPLFVNNVVAGSNSNQTIHNQGSHDNVVEPVLIYNTLVGTGSGTGIYVDEHTHLLLTNTIVVSYTWGIINVAPASSIAHAKKTLFFANDDNGIQGSSPVFGDPLFVNPATDDFHIQQASQARDAGICTSETDDIDGETRPIGVECDIGADEWSMKVSYLPLVVR